MKKLKIYRGNITKRIIKKNTIRRNSHAKYGIYKIKSFVRVVLCQFKSDVYCVVKFSQHMLDFPGTCRSSNTANG